MATAIRRSSSTPAPMINSNMRESMRLGLLAGSATLFTALVGMIVVFSEREVIEDLLTLGQILLFAPTLAVGYLIANRMRSRYVEGLLPALLAGAIAGFFSSLPLLALVILGSQTNIRNMFVNVTSELISLLTFEQDSLLAGSAMLVVALTLSGVIGVIITAIPKRPQRAFLLALVATILAGLMSEFIKQILQQFTPRQTLRAIVSGDALTLQAALVIFVFTFMLSLFWSYRGEAIRNRKDALPASQKRALRGGSYTLLGIFLLLLPWILGIYLSEVIDNVGLYILMGLGLNIAVGWAGLLDLGYVTNFAVGAYVVAVLTSTGPLGFASRTGIDVFNFWIVLPIAVLAAMMTGFILALPVLRMRGDYLAIATLGFGEIIRLLALSDWLKPYIGGAQGVLFIPKPMLSIAGVIGAALTILGLAAGAFVGRLLANRLFVNDGSSGLRSLLRFIIILGLAVIAGSVVYRIYGLVAPTDTKTFEFSGPQQIYYIILAAALLMLFVALRLNNSRTGRQWMAMREDADAASAMGIDITTTKLIAFTLSAASGGLAGAIFATKLGTIFPHSFNLLISINALSLIIVGGIGSIPGVIVGAAALIGIPELLREFSEFRLLLYGAVLVIMMLVRPAGLWPSPITRREMQLDDTEPGAGQPSGPAPALVEADPRTGSEQGEGGQDG